MELIQKFDAVTEIVNAQAEQIAELRGALEAVKSAPTAQVETKDAEGEMKAKFFELVKNGEFSGTQLVKDGVVQAKSFNVTDSTSAGAGIIQALSTQIVRRIIEEYRLPSMFGFETASSVNYEKLVEVGGCEAGWVGENTVGNEYARGSTPRFAKIKMIHGKGYGKTVISAESLTDPFFNAESILVEAMRKALGRTVSQGMLTGKGENVPAGFYTYFDKVEGAKDVDTRKVDHYRVVEADIGTDEQLIAALQGMQFELVTGYLNGAKYIINRQMFQRIAALKDGIGRPLMQTSLDAGYAGRIFGFDIVVDPMAPESVPVVFGRVDDAFKIVSVPTAMDFLRNPYKHDGMVEFSMYQRIGTMVNDNQAVVGLMPAAATRKASK